MKCSATLTFALAVSGLLGARSTAHAGSDDTDYLAASRQVGVQAVAWEEVQRFEFDEAGPVHESWPVPEGDWQVENGELVASGGERNRAILLVPWDTDPIRVEFDALCEAGDEGRIGDITVLLNATPDERFFRSGYALTVASYYNSCATFYRFGKPLAKTEHTPVQPGRRHRVVVEFGDGHIRYWLDGALVLEAWDPEPIVPEAQRYVGLRTWNTRLHIDNLVISGATSPVSAAAPARRSYDCVRRRGPVLVDGRLDDAAWQKGPWLAVDHGLGEGALESTEVCLAWDDVALYAAARLTDRHMTATMRARDSRVWREECLEFFLDPQARGRLYYEIDVNAIGTVYDAVNVQDGGLHRTVMESAWNPEATEVATRRTADGWHLEMRVRFDAMPTARHLPPLPGDVWRANVYRVNAMADGSTTSAAWNPTDAFHDTGKLGALRFVFPERVAEQEKRFTAAAAFLAQAGDPPGKPLAAHLADAKVTSADGEAFTFDPERQAWRGQDARSSLSIDDESDVAGIMLARLDRQALRASWQVAAPTRLALLAHLYPKAVNYLKRGKADGAVLRVTLPGHNTPIDLLVNSARWQLEAMDVPEPGNVVLEVSPGPAGNDVLDKVFVGLYELESPQ